MSKLFSLREWFYIEDAIRHMSARFNEPITERDLFALAMDGRITLSLRFGSSIPVRRAVAADIRPLGSWGADYLHDERCFYVLDKEVSYVDGVFDLPLALGNMDVLRASEWDGGEWSISFNEMLLWSAESDLVVPVQDKGDAEIEIKGLPFNDHRRYSFHYSLPRDCKWVVKTAEICKLEASLEREKAQALTSRERTNLLNIIGALLEQLDQKETALISVLLERHGEKPGIKERTLQQKFAEAKRSLRGS